MDVNITARHVDLNDEIEKHAEEQFGKLDRFFQGVRSVDVVIRLEGHGAAANCHVEATCILEHGTRLRGAGEAGDIIAAIDESEQRLQKQLRRFHAKLKAHRDRSRIAEGGASPAPSEEATYEQVVREMLEEGEQ